MKYKTFFCKAPQNEIPVVAMQNQKFFSWAAGLPYTAKIKLSKQTCPMADFLMADFPRTVISVCAFGTTMRREGNQ